MNKFKLFFQFTKFGWLTLLICFVAFGSATLIAYFAYEQNLFAWYLPVYVVICVLFVYNSYLGIWRILSYKYKKKHYYRLKSIFQKKGYDPKIEKYFTATCDKAVLKELKN